MPLVPGVGGSVLARTRHLELLALGPSQYAALHEALVRPSVAQYWRSRGSYVPLREWERFLTEGLHYGAVVRSVPTGALVGLVELRDYEPVDQHAYLSAAASEPHLGSGLMAEACLVALDEVFARFPLRKVYVLTTPASEAALGEVFNTVFRREGVLADHVCINGDWLDVTVGSINRDGLIDILRRSGMDSLAPEDGWRLTAPSDGRTMPNILDQILPPDLRGAASSTPISDVVTDSMEALVLLIRLEDALGRPVPDELFASIETVGDLLGWMSSRESSV